MFGTPAAAHVVQATSSLPLTDLDVNDTAKVEQALKTAVGQMRRHDRLRAEPWSL